MKKLPKEVLVLGILLVISIFTLDCGGTSEGEQDTTPKTDADVSEKDTPGTDVPTETFGEVTPHPDVTETVEDVCTPQCEGKVCGDNGCGGTCGICKWDEKCEEGKCEVQVSVDSPFGFCDPPIGNPGTNNYDYYKDLGTKWLEFPRENAILGWESMEKEPGKYDFSEVDAELSSHYQQGLNVIWVTRPINKLYGTYWNEFGESDEYPDGHLTEWYNYMRAVAERYDGDGIDDAPFSPKIIINYYQFVHELVPNPNDYWQSHVDQYAEVFELTYRAIKEANPNAVLSMPVGPYDLSHPEAFIGSVLPLLQNKGIADIGFDYHSWNNYEERISYIKMIKDTASQYGWDPEKIKIFSNESGRPDAEGTEEREQAAYVVQAYAVSLANGQTKQFWTRVFDYISTSKIWGNIGLIHNPANSDGLSHKKLAYHTYKKMVEVLEGSDWNNIQTIEEENGIYIYKFTKQGKSIWVAWNDNSTQKQITITGINSSQMKITEAVPKYESGKYVTDYNTAFNIETKSAKDGEITLTLGKSPLFIQEI
jgi:hypothetical protein